MLKTHQQQLVASKELKRILQDMRSDLRQTLGNVKEVMGFNIAALKFVENKVREKGIATVEDVETEEDKNSSKKRAFVHIA
jgi:U3 small nucleolar RNA-associated protein 12